MPSTVFKGRMLSCDCVITSCRTHLVSNHRVGSSASATRGWEFEKQSHMPDLGEYCKGKRSVLREVL